MPLLIWAIPAGLAGLGLAGWGLSDFMESLSWVMALLVVLAVMYFAARYVGWL